MRETLDLDAALHGGDASDVDAVIARLGLASCADTLVGGDTGGKAVRGISGGERRRLAIACETLCLRRRRVGGVEDDLEGVFCPEGGGGGGGVILADEPTTGLDAHQADKIVEKLGETAREERAAVVCVLHQPRSAIFEKLDDLMLLAAGGRVAYCGPAAKALGHFKALGHECPQYYNPAEFLIDLVAVDTDDGPEAEKKDVERVDRIVEAWAATPAALAMAKAEEVEAVLASIADKPRDPEVDETTPPPDPAPMSSSSVHCEDAGEGGAATGLPTSPSEPESEVSRSSDSSRNDATTSTPQVTSLKNDDDDEKKKKKKRRGPPGSIGQFRLLVGRAWKQTRREAWVNGVRLAASVGLAAAFGGCNFNVGFSAKSVKKRAAVLMQACINTSMLALCRSLNGFPRERATVAREMARTRGGYRAGPYFFSKLLVETPVDMLFPVVFGGVMGPMVGLREAGKGWFLTTLALQSAAASCLGLSVGALSPSAEMALAVGPCIMVLSIMLGDETGAFAEVPPSLRGVSNASLIKWAFQGCLCSEFEGLVFDPSDKGGGGKPRGGKRGVKGAAAAVAKNAMEGACPRTGEEVLEGLGLPLAGGAKRAARAQANVVMANAMLTYLVLRVRGA